MTDDDLGCIQLTTQRLRQMDNWEAENPPESGFRILARPSAASRARARLYTNQDVAAA